MANGELSDVMVATWNAFRAKGAPWWPPHRGTGRHPWREIATNQTAIAPIKYAVRERTIRVGMHLLPMPLSGYGSRPTSNLSPRARASAPSIRSP